MSSSSPSSSPRPARVLWLQVALRIFAILVAFSAIVIAIFVSASRHKTWYTVFVSAVLSLIIDTAEAIALGSRYVRRLRDPLPRIHPVILIALDFCALSFYVWSFFSLFFDVYGFHKNTESETYDANPFNSVETWLAVVIGGLHVILLVFDCVDCCSIRQTTTPQYEYRPRQRVRPRKQASRSRDDLFDMEW